jgi:glycosyltransferase involved in cell wall biosynthesis
MRLTRQDRVVVVIAHPLAEAELIELLEHPQVSGVIVGGCSSAVRARFDERVRIIDMTDGTWPLPAGLGRSIIFLDHVDNFGVPRSLSALRGGIRNVVFQATFAFGREKHAVALGWKKHRVVALLFRSAFNAICRRLPGLLPGRAAEHIVAKQTDRLEPIIRGALANSPLLPPADFVPGRVLFVNSSLGPGGAERQVVATVIGLLDRGIRDLSILCENLTPGLNNDFHTKTVKELGITATERHRFVAVGGAPCLEPYISRLSRYLRHLPEDLAINVLGYVAEILVRRPTIIHIWQDDTNAKAGIAAAIVGVPRIVLSGRSVAPHHFMFYQPYMRSAYRALAGRANVTIVNNSRAGARDYEAWLELESSSIQVVHNGFDFSRFRRPDSASVSAYRGRMGIATGRPVVGTIMRLSEEKRPLLWMKVAASLARQRNDLVFLVVGTGVMQAEVVTAVDAFGLKDRVVLAGVEQDAALALAAMDVFLLTSRKEGLPNVLVEAQALGVPVVSTDAGGAAETFMDGVTGRLVASDEPDEIAAGVLAVLDDVPWRERAATAAPAFVQERFSIERMINDTCKLYGVAGNGPLQPETRANFSPLKASGSNQ